MTRPSLPPLLALLLWTPAVEAKITTKVTLEQLVKDMPLVFTAKVTEYLPEKPGMVMVPVDQFRGEFKFDRVPVNLTGDQEARKENQTAAVLERLDKDVVLVVFAARDEVGFDALAFTNGTWLRMAGVSEKDGDKEVTRWRFAHCETYFRRTFKGTTDDLISAVRGGLKGEKLPPYDEKQMPGYGPPLKKAKAGGNEPVALGRPSALGRRRLGTTPSQSASVPLGVIQIPFLGVIAALAALFPAVFGGMALLMRRWVAALTVASVVSILSALVLYFPNWIGWTGLRSV